MNGFMEVPMCPWKYAAGATVALEAAQRAKQGSWPIGGGWLDQTRQCLEAVDFVRLVEAQCEAANATE